jgi:hypothetical protein
VWKRKKVPRVEEEKRAKPRGGKNMLSPEEEKYAKSRGVRTYAKFRYVSGLLSVEEEEHSKCLRGGKLTRVPRRKHGESLLSFEVWKHAKPRGPKNG